MKSSAPLDSISSIAQQIPCPQVRNLAISRDLFQQYTADELPIVWFDIDNTLYSASSKISQAMGERIHSEQWKTLLVQLIFTGCTAYFVKLGLDHEEASKLHLQYYTRYGLALRGLTRHHDVGNASPFPSQYTPHAHEDYLLDPLDFDRQCDGSLPLEDMIKFSPSLRKLFEDIDRKKVRVWALTNANRPVHSNSSSM